MWSGMLRKNNSLLGKLSDKANLLGRFYSLRTAYSAIKSIKGQTKLRFHRNNIENAEAVIPLRKTSLFRAPEAERVLAELKAHGIAGDLYMVDDLINQVGQYAEQALFRVPTINLKGTIADIQEWQKTNGMVAVRAICTDAIFSSPLSSVAGDPLLYQLAKAYLRYAPTRVEAYFEILLAGSPEDKGEQYGPHDFHYDVPGLNSMGFIFYANDVHPDNGPHIMILGSHRTKPFSLLIQSGEEAGKHVGRHYPSTAVRTVVGLRGYGFAEDFYCFHRVLPLIRGSRLALQLRYS
jgi:hypothetical protein